MCLTAFQTPFNGSHLVPNTILCVSRKTPCTRAQTNPRTGTLDPDYTADYAVPLGITYQASLPARPPMKDEACPISTG